MASEMPVVNAEFGDRPTIELPTEIAPAGLKVVDEHLQHLRENQAEQMGRRWVKAGLWGGGYVGEVIRRKSNGNDRNERDTVRRVGTLIPMYVSPSPYSPGPVL